MVGMGGSMIFDWGGPHIEKAQDDRQNVALFALKSWPIGGGGAWPRVPPHTLEPPLVVGVLIYYIYLREKLDFKSHQSTSIFMNFISLT